MDLTLSRLAGTLKTAFKINKALFDASGVATARTIIIPDKAGTLAMTSDITGTNSGTNTGDNAPNTLYSGLVTNATHTGDATGATALTVKGINGTLLSGLATGILKNTTTTGVPSIAIAGDFPTLNQSTSGTAAKATILETTRAIYGNNFDGSAALTGIIASTYGGTGNGFTKFTGPATAEKTFTLPNSSETLLYSGGALGTPASGTLTNCTFPTLNQNTSGSSASCTGNSATATTFIGNQTNYASYRLSAVANMLGWKKYGNGHVIFDASASTSPANTAVNDTTPDTNWVATYPTLMGWNGANTFGVRVDTSRVSESCSGTAAKTTILETTRAIYGNNFNGSAALTGIIASTYGGTGNGFTKFTGPATAEKTFTLPNSSETLLYSGGALGTPSSGTLTSCTGLPYNTGITAAPHTLQVFTSGSGTYTKPTNCVAIKVTMVGGGGGGGGSGTTTTGGTGGTGGTSTFGTTLLSAAGGAGGVYYGPGGNGGAASLGGVSGVALTGGKGLTGQYNVTYAIGGSGAGSSAFGGAGASGPANSAGVAGTTNTGGGGGGGTMSVYVGNASGGGGAGGTVIGLIASPNATYSYAVGGAGTAGAAGTNGFAGGAGAAGLIVVEEYYF